MRCSFVNRGDDHDVVGPDVVEGVAIPVVVQRAVPVEDLLPRTTGTDRNRLVDGEVEERQGVGIAEAILPAGLRRLVLDDEDTHVAVIGARIQVIDGQLDVHRGSGEPVDSERGIEVGHRTVPAKIDRSLIGGFRARDASGAHNQIVAAVEVGRRRAVEVENISHVGVGVGVEVGDKGNVVGIQDAVVPDLFQRTMRILAIGSSGGRGEFGEDRVGEGPSVRRVEASGIPLVVQIGSQRLRRETPCDKHRDGAQTEQSKKRFPHE